MELLREHSREGYEMLKKLNFDPELCDVALGHHKSYDGKHGYPANFDHTASSARFMIDLFRICDRMEAATDEIGRVYRQNRGIGGVLGGIEAGRRLSVSAAAGGDDLE